MINRSAIILKYKPPAVSWINEADPIEEHPGITIEDVNEDRTIYLIDDENAEDPDILEVWLRMNVEVMFENELLAWYQDESLWPKHIDYELFESWFDVECHSIVVDTVGTEIIDDEA